MNFRLLILQTITLVVLAQSSFALEVVRARYGSDRRYNDVSDIVQRYADQGVRSFYVNNESMRGDPDKGDKKFLTVEYVNRGRRYRETAKEGTNFRFEGPLVPGGDDFHFPGVPPGRPAAELTVDNESDDTVRVYSLNEWGSWQWVGSVRPGRSLVAPAVFGQEWRVTDERGRTVERATVRRSTQRVVVGGGIFPGGSGYGNPDDYYYGGGGSYISRLTIQNAARSPLRVYTVNPGRDWQHVRDLPPGSSAAFSTEPGRKWLVTDYANRVVRGVRAEAGNSVLRIP
jgi:hypothetical protein